MDFKNDGVIGNLPKNINKEVPTPNDDESNNLGNLPSITD